MPQWVGTQVAGSSSDEEATGLVDENSREDSEERDWTRKIWSAVIGRYIVTN